MSPIYMAILWPYIEDKPISGASGSQAQADAIQARAAQAAAEAEVEAGRRAQKKTKNMKRASQWRWNNGKLRFWTINY